MLKGLGVTTVVEPTDEPSAKGVSAGYAESIDREVIDFPTLDPEYKSDYLEWRKANVIEDSNAAVNFGTVWLDVEDNPSSGCSWASYSASSNCDYLGQLISAVKSHSRAVGVYTSEGEWESVMGSLSACANVASSSVPLWYAHYDNSASFSDYVKIGGWSSPAMK